MNIHENAKTTPKMRGLIVERRQAGKRPGRITPSWPESDSGAGRAGAGDLCAGRGGAELHAFDPNSDAFRVLTEPTKTMPNVHCHQQAMLDHDAASTGSRGCS